MAFRRDNKPNSYVCSPLFVFKIMTWNTKIYLFYTVVKFSLSSSRKKTVLQKRALKRIFEPTIGKATRNMGKWLSEELHNFRFSQNMTVMMK